MIRDKSNADRMELLAHAILREFRKGKMEIYFNKEEKKEWTVELMDWYLEKFYLKYTNFSFRDPISGRQRNMIINRKLKYVPKDKWMEIERRIINDFESKYTGIKIDVDRL